ncbi:MAG TPA: helix-turn-helix domain-containing protein [Rhizomicrobium sp.]|jgi:AcrR family transcriptional regulator|nr:helix-turn-helix domain-containing protein [Rhizomicrobium sp.]
MTKPLRAPSQTPVIPIRDAQKALTHGRILNAARRLFFERGFHITTIDEIACASGVQRSTVYLHFRDKSAMLDEIADEYLPHGVALMEKLPGPCPTHGEILNWLEEAVKLVDTDRVPLSIIREVWVSSSPELANLNPFKKKMLAGLAKNVPAFGAAREEDNLEAFAAASLLLMQTDIACNSIVHGGRTPYNLMLLDRVAANMEAFIKRYNAC